LIHNTGYGNATGGTGNQQLAINWSTVFPGEVSNWQFSECLIWNTQLADSNMLAVSLLLSSHLSTGKNVNEIGVPLFSINQKNDNLVFLKTNRDYMTYSGFADNTWKYITITHNSNTTKMYLNGVETSNVSLLTLNKSSVNRIRIGGIANNTYIDDLRIYDKVLTLDEITKLYLYTETKYSSISIKKSITNLLFQIYDTSVYQIPYNTDNTWTHILWNIKNAANTPFIRLSTISLGTEQTYTYIAPSSGIYINKLGSLTNIGSVNISDFRIFTTALTTSIKNDLYSPIYSSYTTLVNDIQSSILTLNRLYPWITSNINVYYIAGNIGIGILNYGTNSLAIYNGDLNITGGIIKRRLTNTSNFQLLRWNNSANYYTGTPKFITYTDGYVGIRTNNPQTNLHVGAGTANTRTNMVYFSSTIYPTSNNYTLQNICSTFDASIVVSGTIASSSDTRIKTNIADINDDSALNKILAIQPKTYNYIDHVRGTSNVYGFIAQQIKQVIPEATNLQTDVIPNIYTYADCSGDTITLPSEINILSNEYLKPSALLDIIHYDAINNVESRNMYSINSTDPLTNTITINRPIDASKVFIYGVKVKDFCTLNKSYIYTLNVCATQTLARKLNMLKTKVNNITKLNQS
jgi:hypothetical protein